MTTSRKIARVLVALTMIGGMAIAAAASITAPIGSQPGGTAAYTFVGASDGNVWLNTSYGGYWHWQNLAPLNVSFGVGVTAPGGNPAAYAVGTDGNLYIIHQIGSSWSTVNIGTPPGVALRTPVGVMSNTSNQPFVFLIGSDGNLWLAHNAGSWTWRNLERPSGVALAQPVGAVNVPGSYPQIFVIGSDGNLWVSQWNGSSYPWSNVGNRGTLQGLAAWVDGTAPYAWLLADGYIWFAAQFTGGGPWTWYDEDKNIVAELPLSFTVGMPLNDETVCFVTKNGTFLVESYYGTSPKYIDLTGTSYVATASAGAADTGNGNLYVFLINTSGHLEAIYGTSGNLGNATALDFGTPP